MLKTGLNLRKVIAIAICLASTTIFSGCDKESPKDPLTYDEGVVINGVKWATRNVDTFGTFATKPENAGMIYQWNHKAAWPTTGDIISWYTIPPKSTAWAKANDPSPAGWRIPTFGEINTLLDANKVSNEWIAINNVNGRKFTDKVSGKSIFLPAVGFRDDNGMLLWAGSNGHYWSTSQPVSDGAPYLVFNSNRTEVLFYLYLNYGRSVRSVAE
jgi:uncharacterized protein (TIGR02145 family)